MQPQIVHEAEVHRQHVRLRIPIQVEIDGVRYQVDDWSVGGFGVESVITSRQPDERFSVRMIFPFEEFDMAMRLDARMVYVDQDHGRFGGAFVGLSREQQAVFRYLVDAYLSGEVVSAGDLLQVRARDASAAPRVPPAAAPFSTDEPWLARLRRYAVYSALGLAGFALAGVIALGVYERFFTVTVNSAVIEAPLVEMQAPVTGRFFGAPEAGSLVAVGTRLGMIEPVDGGAVVTLESPCDCVVLEALARDGLYYQVGAPLLALIEEDEPLRVRAQLPLDEVEGLEPGDRAEIRIPGRPEPRHGEIVRIDLRPRLEALRNPDAPLPVAGHLARVLIRPDRPFELDAFGTLVTVRFL